MVGKGGKVFVLFLIMKQIMEFEYSNSDNKNRNILSTVLCKNLDDVT